MCWLSNFSPESQSHLKETKPSHTHPSSYLTTRETPAPTPWNLPRLIKPNMRLLCSHNAGGCQGLGGTCTWLPRSHQWQHKASPHYYITTALQPAPFTETSSGRLSLNPNPSTPSPIAVITPAVCYSNSDWGGKSTDYPNTVIKGEMCF